MGKHFLWDPVEDNIIEEFDDAGNTIADYTTEPHLYGDLISQNRNGQSSFYHYDGQGSTTSLTDLSASVTDTYAYNSFGEATESTGTTVNFLRFMGRDGLRSEDGFLLARWRTCTPAFGRWMSQDPLGRHPSVSIKGRMAFSYAAFKNNPVLRRDPTGLLDVVIEPNNGDLKGLPFYTDPLLDKWKINVLALNNACFKVEGKCVKDHIVISKIHIYVFITVNTGFVADENWPGIYGHERQHLYNLVTYIKSNTDLFEKLFADAQKQRFPCCESVLDQKLAEAAELSWRLAGQFFRHNWVNESGDLVGNPWGPGISEPVILDEKVPGKPNGSREAAKLPSNGKDGWFCPFDETLVKKRSWPDWEFGQPYPKPDQTGPDEGEPLPLQPRHDPIVPSPPPKRKRPPFGLIPNPNGGFMKHIPFDMPFE